MGGKDESEVKTIIRNQINVEIENSTKQITNVINETSQEVVNKMTQEIASSVTQKTGASNTIAADTIAAIGPGSTLTIEQQAEVEAKNNALIQILSSADSMTKMANQMTAAVQDKITQTAAAKQSMDTVAKIGELQKTGGGPEGMVDSIAGMVGGMMKSATGSSSSSKSTTEITNEIKTKLINSTEITNNVSSIVKNKIENAINQKTSATCNFDTTATNTINVKDILAAGGGTISLKQKVSVKAFNDCIQKLSIGTKIVEDLASTYTVEKKSDTTQKAESVSELKSESAITKTTIQESAIMSTIDNLISGITGVMSSGLIIGGIIVVIAVGGIIYLFGSGAVKVSDLAAFTPAGQAKGALQGITGNISEVAEVAKAFAPQASNEDDTNDDNEEQEGGGLFNNKLYAIGSLIAFLILIARKSIPLCGALLIIIFLYFMNKTI
jgi:hypothetical protein